MYINMTYTMEYNLEELRRYGLDINPHNRVRSIISDGNDITGITMSPAEALMILPACLSGITRLIETTNKHFVTVEFPTFLAVLPIYQQYARTDKWYYNDLAWFLGGTVSNPYFNTTLIDAYVWACTDIYMDYLNDNYIGNYGEHD